MKKLFTVVALTAFLAGCGTPKSDYHFDWAALAFQMQADGWNYSETLGVPGEAVAETHLSSETGILTAVWITNGKREKKVYDQHDAFYAIVVLQKKNGDTFAVIFRKEKTK